ncbi:glycosyltransferase family 4 protein [Leptospira sp. 201903070]|uniref:Glycosyltransferase family 4 protein n=1 Tax=Leptospira ainlahdjerensis TaxID=2810033 RepID=A0ABS2UDH4_9LEPT|nr:glycosyltransferase family 4 protein [Leptospira ainlahdjerensis]MBM9577292.1 glycosyltransferase family 4 protein [Leptospira ainlahdjerensis]
MKILFIAPLPPPINGHSLVSKVLYDSLVSEHDVEVVNLRKQSLKEGMDSFRRVIEILNVLFQTFRKKKNSDILYFTISESLAGNLKDLLIYAICFRLIGKMYVHLHGGSLKKLLFDRYPFLFRVNRFFLSRVGGVILSGESHLEIFENYVSRDKISIVPNFAQDEIFASEDEIKQKFKRLDPLRILFVSNMIPLKGYSVLLEGFLGMESKKQKDCVLDFAGRFDTEEEKSAFELKIRNHNNVHYHGLINDAMKNELFKNAHVFCLPTMFFEGQPVSILEAYASGCFVVTTGQSGILDIFTENINGFLVKEGSAESISTILNSIVGQKKEIFKIAEKNWKKAIEDYRAVKYTSRLKKIIGV